MTAERSVDALVLDTVAYRDKDLVVRLLTPDDGVVSAMAFSARQSKRRFPSGLDRLTLVEATLAPRTRGMPVCKQATTRDVFWTLRTDLESSAGAALLCDVLLQVHLDASEAPDVFSFAVASLQTLDQQPPGSRPAIVLFLLLGLLRRVGFVPESLDCPQCAPGHLAKQYRMRSDSGAIWCREHDRSGPHRVPLSAADVDLMQKAIDAGDLATFAQGASAQSSGALSLLERLLPWVEGTLGGRLRSFSFFRSLYAKEA